MNLYRIVLALATTLLVLTACKETEAPADAPPKPVKTASSGPASRPGAGRAKAADKRLESSPAGKLVARSIERHGGLEAWYGAGAIAFEYAYRPVGDKPARVSKQVIDIATSRAYHDLTEPMQGRFAWDGKKAWMKLEGGKLAARFWALTPYYFVGMPFVLGDPGVQLEIVDDDPKAAGLQEAADVVKVTFAPGTGDAPDDYYVLYLAKDDGELLGLRYIVTYFDRKPREKLVVYEDERPAGPLKIARKHTFYTFDEKRGELVTNGTVDDVEVGAKFDESRLEMPEGAVIDETK